VASRTTERRKAPVWSTVISQRAGVPGVEDLLEAKRIPLEAIGANPDQPRRGPLPDIPELAAHIAAYGLLQPIVVTTSVAGRYTLIAGARRLAAFRQLLDADPEHAGWATIPAIERETDTPDRVLLALAENLSRHNLSDADTITSLRVLRDLRGWTQAEIAHRLGTTKAWISQQFAVAGDPVLSEHVQTGALSVAKAYEVHTAWSPDAKDAALDAALQGAPLRRIRKLAKDNAPQDRVAPPHDDVPDTDSQLSDLTAVTAAAASPSAGAHDLADLADELGLTIDLEHTELAKLIRSALTQGTTVVSAGSFLRLMRADGRVVEGLVRSEQHKRQSG
jgi:ParB/RepB/Spo0J family partition protein